MKYNKIKHIINLHIPAGDAQPKPPISSQLAPKQVKAMEFCKQFNEQSLQLYEKSTIISTSIIIYNDNTFTFYLKGPSVSYILKRILNVVSLKTISAISAEQLDYAVDQKFHPAWFKSKEACKLCVTGSLRSMGITVVN